MKLSARQWEVAELIREVARIAGIDKNWSVAHGMVESSLGVNRRSPTGAKGVFGMTSIAMKDLLQEMENDDTIAILCGVAFLKLLHDRHGEYRDATLKYCDPKDRDFYWARVKDYWEKFKWGEVK